MINKMKIFGASVLKTKSSKKAEVETRGIKVTSIKHRKCSDYFISFMTI